MRLRLFLLGFALANLSYNGVEQAMTAQSEPRSNVLSAEDMMRILPGHTLLTYDNGEPFWMYYPAPGTVWGQSSNGDVDVGRWWTEKDRYCRAWRRWYGGAPQCWNLASLGENRIAWIDKNSVRGETLLQPGNTIGTVLPQAQLASLNTEIDVNAVSVSSGIGPGPRTEFADRDAAQGGSRSGSSSRDPSGGGNSSGAGGGSSGGGDPSGGGGSNSSGHSSSGSGGSNGSSGGNNGGNSSSGGGSNGGSSSGGGDNSSGGGDPGGGSHGKGDKDGKHDHGDKGGRGGKGKD